MITSIPQLCRDLIEASSEKGEGVLLLSATFGNLVLEWDSDFQCHDDQRWKKSHTAPSLTICQLSRRLFIPIKIFFFLSPSLCALIIFRSLHSAWFIFLQTSLFWIHYKFLPNISYPIFDSCEENSWEWCTEIHWDFFLVISGERSVRILV